MLPESDIKTPPAIYIFIIILPFIILYWMAPFVTDLTLGADYQLFSINEQMEILFSIKTGSFPLYVPGYKHGHSASALTLSQVYHPISHIASLLPGYWNGKALEWNTFLRLLSLGFVHLVMFAFLRKIKTNMLFSFIISLIAVYNIRMLEAFRYGASLEAYTGNLLLCTLIGWYFISPSRWLGPLCIIGATYLLVCSGHPPMMFYGLLGAGIFTLVAPFFLATMLSERGSNFKIAFMFWIKVGFYILLGILLSAAYILPFYLEFIPSNIEYSNLGLQSHMGQDTLVGTFNNFFMPLTADVLAGFGGSSLMLITLILPLLLCFRVKIPLSVWAVWGILFFSLLYIQGPQTPVFRLIYEYFPLVSSAGGVGRISMILPFLLMLLMVWIINAEPFLLNLRGRSVTVAPYVQLSLISLILIPLYLLPVFLLKPALGNFTPHFIRNIPFIIELVSVIFGMASLAALIFYGMYPRLARVAGIFLCIVIFLQIGTILKYGMFIDKKYDKPTFEQIMVHKKEKMDFHFLQNPGLFHSVVLNHLARSFIEPFLGKIYTQVIPVSSQDDAYRKMERERLPQQVFVEGYDPEKAKFMTEKGKNVKEGIVNLIYSSFNSLKFRVVSPEPVFFGFSYPFTGHWKAWVNDEKVHVYRANGIAHAVEIPEGESLIEFRYWSDAFLGGMVVSFTTFAVIGLFTCFRGLRGMPRIIVSVVVLALSAGWFMMWYNNLYRGDNLKTEYDWSYASSLKTPNFAYGKKSISYYHDNSSMLRLYSNMAVDGDVRPGSGLILRPLDEALVIDLNQIQGLERIVLHGDLKTNPEISLSKDNMQWQRIAPFISGDLQTSPMQIIFKEPKDARFIKVMAVDSILIIDEIEAYSEKLIISGKNRCDWEMLSIIYS